jgi:hypothetical protein
MTQLKPADSFVVRSWNGQTIRMRAGRVCLTDLCKAGETGSGNPIRFAHWFESDATQRFLQHRSAVTGREVFAISSAIDNAENSALIVRESERGDAWGDEVVSLKLAGRLCTELEHEIYQWYAETRVSQVRDTQPLALAPAPNEDLAFAGLVATMVEKVGGSAKNSLAISFTALANKHPDYRQLFLENQRLLCPSAEEFVNQTKILEGLESEITEPIVDHLTALAKEAGFITKKDKRQLVNALLCQAGLQFRTSDKRRGQAPYALTKQGARYAREETRPAMYQDDGAWVPQLLWNFQETLAFLISWINSNLQPVSSRG